MNLFKILTIESNKNIFQNKQIDFLNTIIKLLIVQKYILNWIYCRNRWKKDGMFPFTTTNNSKLEIITKS